MTNTQKNIDNLKTKLQEILSKTPSELIEIEKNSFDQQATPFQDRIILFGSGGLGKKILQGLRRVGVEPLAFVDNNPDLWNRKIEDLVVLEPQKAFQMYGENSTFVITIWRAGGVHRFDEMQKELYERSCKRVVSFAFLFWKYSEQFLPYYSLGIPHILQAQKEDIIKAYELLADDDSRLEYISQIRFRFNLDFANLASPVSHAHYFPDDLFDLLDDEVFVDCGAFDGDSIQNFYKVQSNFQGKIFAIEPDPANITKMKDFLLNANSSFQKAVSILSIVVGTHKGKIRFSANGTASSMIDPNGSIEIDCFPIDELLGQNKATFIKMDIEGAELDALQSAKNSIQKDSPVLAISVYHKPDDLWKIPLFIQSLSNQYKFYLRPHNEEGWDLVLYAIPKNRLKRGVR